MDKKVSINILNYNTFEKSCICIDSCLIQKGKNYRIILIDNASTDNSYVLLKRKYGDRIEFYQTGDNYGYAGGNNKGILKNIEDGYKYSFMLNSDTELIGDCLVESLLQIIENYSDCAVAAPLIYDITSKGLQMAKNDSSYVKMLRYFHVLPENNKINDYIETKSEAHGSALLVDNEVFIKCGGFPEHYFMYAEESLLSKKIIWSGYRIYWLNRKDIYIKHHHDTSRATEPWRKYLMGRNASLEFLENRHGKNKLWLLAFFIFSLRSFLLYLIKHDKFHFAGILDGIKLFFYKRDKDFIFQHGKQARLYFK